MKTDTQNQHHLSLWSKLPFRIALFALAALLVLGGLVVVFWPTATVEQKAQSRRPYAVISDPNAAETLLYYGAEPLAAAQGFLRTRYTALGGAWDVVLTETGELHLMHDGASRCLATDVLDVRLAAKGGGVLYLTHGSRLYLQTEGELEPTLICEDFSEPSLDLAVISPAGKRLFYVTADGEGEQSAFLWDGENRRLDQLVVEDGLYPLGVSDDAAHLYYVTSSGTALYHANAKGQANKLTASFSKDFAPVQFNSTLSQILFCEGNGYTYFCEKGQEKKKLSSGVATPVLSQGEGEFVSPQSSVYSVDALQDRFYFVTRDEARTLRYVDASLGSKKCAADVQDAYPTEDGKKLYVVRYSESRYRIYLLDLSNEVESETLVASGVLEYAVTPDAQSVYYITRGNRLFCRNAGTSTLLAEGAFDVALSPKGEVFWTVKTAQTESALYSFRDGEAQFLAGGVTDFFFSDSTLYVCANDNGLSRWFSVLGTELSALVRP